MTSKPPSEKVPMSLAHQSLIIILFITMFLDVMLIMYVLNSGYRTPALGFLIAILPVSSLAIAYIIVCDYGAEIRRLRENQGLNPVDGSEEEQEQETHTEEVTE